MKLDLGTLLGRRWLIALIPLAVVLGMLLQQPHYRGRFTNSVSHLLLTTDDRIVPDMPINDGYGERPDWAHLPELEQSWKELQRGTIDGPHNRDVPVVPPEATLVFDDFEVASSTLLHDDVAPSVGRRLTITYPDGSRYIAHFEQPAVERADGALEGNMATYQAPPRPWFVDLADGMAIWIGLPLFMLGFFAVIIGLAGGQRPSSAAAVTGDGRLGEPTSATPGGTNERAHAPSVSSASALLVERWLRRSRVARFVGGTIGGSIALGQEVNPYGPTGLSVDMVVLWIIGGVAAGGAVAELHLLRRSRRSGASADLRRRALADYTLAPDRIALAAVGVLSMALFGSRSAGLLAGSASAALVPSAIALATVAFQYAVVVRRRPALSPELRGADDMIRRLAATRGFARPGIAAAIAALAYALQPEGSPMDWVQLGLLLVAVGWLFSGREARSPKLLASFAPA